jgi:Ser/Thr protein kinase RdoA (MazF antagonist)
VVHPRSADADDPAPGKAEPSGRRAPFAALDPSCVIDALAGVGFACDGRLVQLNSYENRVYQAFLDDGGMVVAKFYRPARWSDAQIDEEHRFVAQLAAAELPVAAPITLNLAGPVDGSGEVHLLTPTLAATSTTAGTYRFSVTQRLSGRAPEFGTAPELRQIGRLIGRLHAVGATQRFKWRQTLDVASLGQASLDWIVSHDILPPASQSSWQRAASTALAAVDEAFRHAGALRSQRIHGDCHLGNILWATEGAQFVDFDDCCTGPAVQDLWMLLSGERTAMAHQLGLVLEGYETFVDFDRREVGLVEPLRTLRMLHHSAWIARRWDDPAFPIAFPWFAEPAYWEQQAGRLLEQVEAIQAPALHLPSA